MEMYEQEIINAKHLYIHPKREELLNIFSVTWALVNLQQRRRVKIILDRIETRLNYWQTEINKHDNDWYIRDQIMELMKHKERVKKRIYFLKKISQDRKEAIIKGIDPATVVPKEYDKERILEIPIKRVLELHGHRPKQSTQNDDTYLCVFHNDSNPSMNVSREKNLYYCFSCQAGGDVISMYQHLSGCTFPQALKELSNYI